MLPDPFDHPIVRVEKGRRMYTWPGHDRDCSNCTLPMSAKYLDSRDPSALLGWHCPYCHGWRSARRIKAKQRME